MGGHDKPLIEYQGQPMVEHVSLSVPNPNQTWISANRNLHRYAKWEQFLQITK